MPVLDIINNTGDPAAVVQAGNPGTLQFYAQGQAPATGFQVDSAGNVTTPGTVTSGAQVNASLTVNPGPVTIQPATSGGNALVTNVLGTDANNRFRLTADGGQAIGPGNAALDTFTGRAGVGEYYIYANANIGTVTDLGDNGTGEIKLANAITVPTTNPTGGSVIYAVNGGVFIRDPNGTVSPLVPSNKVGAPMPGAMAETANRNTITTDFGPVSGTLYIFSVQLMAGQQIGHIGFCTGAAANTPTHWWAAVLDNTYKQRAHSADQLTAALPANTWQNLAMTTPYVATYTGTHYVALLFTATTTAHILSTATAFNANFITGANVPTPLVGGLSTTGLTVPGTDGTTTYAAPTAASQTMYVYASA
ncbi:MAG TPA: hypothetical protein VFK47_20755 [Ktedonobacteraceae bacterium]|nr:hypothetical protein [Ktedonobacteraceae bacterium]